MQLGMQGRLQARVGGRVQVAHVPRVAPGVEELVKAGRREVDARKGARLVLGVQVGVGVGVGVRDRVRVRVMVSVRVTVRVTVRVRVRKLGLGLGS